MANPNTLYSPEHLTSTALALVQGDLGLANTITRSCEADFQGQVGYSVNIRRPNTLGARTRVLTSGQGTAITADAVSESVVSVALDTEVYSAVSLSDAELTMVLSDFAGRVTKPQTDSIVQHIEGLIAAQLSAVSPTIDLSLASATTTVAAFSAARKTLRSHKIPSGGLYAVCGVDVYAALLDFDLVRTDGGVGADADRRSVRGFNIIEHNGMAADRVVFYHPAAFHLALRAPIVPQGVTWGASMASNGVALRAIRDYDASLLVDRQVINTYVGIDNLGVVERAANGTQAVYVPAVAADPDAA